MIALIVSTIAWVLALASVSRVWASSAMANPAGVLMAPGLLTLLMAAFLFTFALLPAVARSLIGGRGLGLLGHGRMSADGRL